MDNYNESRAIISKISATSRASIKIKDSFYTMEYTEERLIPNNDDTYIDIEKERQMLWDTVNNEVDTQIQEIVTLANAK